MIRTHSFRKHPCKLEIKSDGDISDGAFYRSSYNFSIRHRIKTFFCLLRLRLFISKTDFYTRKTVKNYKKRKNFDAASCQISYSAV